MAIHLPGKELPLRSIRLSLADVGKIYERLARHVAEQGDREVGSLPKPVDQTDEEFEKFKKIAREKAFRITVTITGSDGASLYGDDVGVFGSPNLPDIISSIFMTNITAYRGFAESNPDNSFKLTFDFSKPPLMDSDNPVSSPTPNGSNLAISGSRDSWVASISDAVLGIVDTRKTGHNWVHRAFLYDYGVFFIGLPVGLYACWKLSGFIETQLGSINTFLSALAYVYAVLATLWLYRLFFGYTRWAFPAVELNENKSASRRHIAFWYVIAGGIAVNIIWQALPWAFGSGA